MNIGPNYYWVCKYTLMLYCFYLFLDNCLHNCSCKAPRTNPKWKHRANNRAWTEGLKVENYKTKLIYILFGVTFTNNPFVIAMIGEKVYCRPFGYPWPCYNFAHMFLCALAHHYRIVINARIVCKMDYCTACVFDCKYGIAAVPVLFARQKDGEHC